MFSSNSVFTPRVLIASVALSTLFTVHAVHAQSNPTQTPVVDETASQDFNNYAARVDVQRWAQATAQKYNLDAKEILKSLSKASYQSSVAKAIMPPPAGTGKNWVAYRARFTDAVRVKRGVAFTKENAELLKKAERQYGIPASIIVGILGVETIYGLQRGNYRALDALTTLAFDFPAGRRDRSAFFQDELAELFVIAQREKEPIENYKSSYAGALGWPQFMPSSWNKYAVDGDGDGHINLRESVPDAVMSVANYLKAFGWVEGMPTHYPVSAPIQTSQRAALLQPDIVPTFTAEEMTRMGAVLTSEAMKTSTPLALIELQNGQQAPVYFAGTNNFYVITRYNWSSYYAKAVIDLGDIVTTASGWNP